jgi:hypothetical protein
MPRLKGTVREADVSVSPRNRSLLSLSQYSRAGFKPARRCFWGTCLQALAHLSEGGGTKARVS